MTFFISVFGESPLVSAPEPVKLRTPFWMVYEIVSDMLPVSSSTASSIVSFFSFELRSAMSSSIDSKSDSFTDSSSYSAAVLNSSSVFSSESVTCSVSVSSSGLVTVSDSSSGSSSVTPSKMPELSSVWTLSSSTASSAVNDPSASVVSSMLSSCTRTACSVVVSASAAKTAVPPILPTAITRLNITAVTFFFMLKQLLRHICKC